jgi:hypothetical protein
MDLTYNGIKIANVKSVTVEQLPPQIDADGETVTVTKLRLVTEGDASPFLPSEGG